MKHIKAASASSSIHSRPTLYVLNATCLSTLSLSAQISSLSRTRFLSVYAFCRVSPLNKVTINNLVLFAMRNTCIRGFHGIHCRTPLSTARRRGNGSRRMFSTCTAPLVSPTTSLIVRPFSPLVLAAHFTKADVPQRSDEWFALRKNKLTTSTFSTALGFWKGNRRVELWKEKVFTPEKQVVEPTSRNAMEWGLLNEEAAIDHYKSITGRTVNSLGFAIHSEERYGWLGASPDGLLECFSGGGILEVKCPYNKGKPEKGLPWSTMPFYYMPQVQGQLEIMDREWADLYCWTPNGSTIFRVCRDRYYWQIIHEILREFWWENVIPAREALLLEGEEKAKSYQPTSTHKQTGLAISRSLRLAGESKLLCREVAGHIEFYR